MNKNSKISNGASRGLQVVGSKADPAKKHLVVLEGNRRLLSFLRTTLGAQYHLHCFEEPGLFVAALERLQRVDLILYSWNAETCGTEPLQAARKLLPEVPVVLLCCAPEDVLPATGSGDVSLLLKPFTPDQLQTLVADRLRAHGEPVVESETKESVLDSTHSFVRASQAMHEVERQAALVAKSDIPVLILGESGTGKEILAIFLHSMSRRKQRTFMKINCAAMPAELLESELFGYEQGAFTGANRTKPGKFEVCDGGTIFLDEIGEMPMPLQAKLLQVLQDGTFSRLGSRSTMRADVRVLSATNVAMKKAMAEGQFREDLYYRLNGISIKLPPLRERKEEIPVLIKHFIQKGAARFGLEPLSVSPELQAALLRYSWPGNLRELENLMNRLLVLRQESAVLSELEERDVAVAGPAAVPVAAPTSPEELTPADIITALEENRWNRRATADALNLTYKALLYKIKLYELESKSA